MNTNETLKDYHKTKKKAVLTFRAGLNKFKFKIYDDDNLRQIHDPSIHVLKSTFFYHKKKTCR